MRTAIPHFSDVFDNIKRAIHGLCRSPRLAEFAVFVGILLSGWNFYVQKTVHVQISMDTAMPGGIHVFYCPYPDVVFSSTRCIDVPTDETTAFVDVAIPVRQLFGLKVEFGPTPMEFSILGGVFGDLPLPHFKYWTFSSNVTRLGSVGGKERLRFSYDGANHYMQVSFYRPIKSASSFKLGRFLLVLSLAMTMVALSFMISKYVPINWGSIVFCTSPLFILLWAIVFLDFNPFHWVPIWNDEVGWFVQVNAVRRYGAPLGFSGYNETHAAIGTFGPWGGAIVYAMAFFATIFGWKHFSPLFMNVFYMTLSNFIFYILVRPKKNATLRLTFLNGILFVSIHYMFIGMSESTRFSMSVILAGIFCFLLDENNRNRKSYPLVLQVIAPVLLLFFTNCYIMFSCLFPVYGYILFQYLNPKKKRILKLFSLCVLIPTFTALACIVLVFKTSAPYPNGLQSFFHKPTMGILYKALCDTVANNYRYANLSFIFNNTYIAKGCVSSYILFCYFLLAVSIVRLIATFKRTGKVFPADCLVIYIMLTFICAFLILYSTKQSWTYIRGLNVAFVFCMYIICSSNWHRAGQLLFCLAFMQLLSFSTIIRENIVARVQPRNECGYGYEMFEQYALLFSSKLHVSKAGSKWDNTIALYGDVYNFYCMIPAGFSLNCIMNNRPVDKPKYIFADKARKRDFKGYLETYSDDYFSIYEKIHSHEEL